MDTKKTAVSSFNSGIYQSLKKALYVSKHCCDTFPLSLFITTLGLFPYLYLGTVTQSLALGLFLLFPWCCDSISLVLGLFLLLLEHCNSITLTLGLFLLLLGHCDSVSLALGLFLLLLWHGDSVAGTGVVLIYTSPLRLYHSPQRLFLISSGPCDFFLWR
jgi:hypothetical protein